MHKDVTLGCRDCKQKIKTTLTAKTHKTVSCKKVEAAVKLLLLCSSRWCCSKCRLLSRWRRKLKGTLHTFRVHPGRSLDGPTIRWTHPWMDHQVQLHLVEPPGSYLGWSMHIQKSGSSGSTQLRACRKLFCAKHLKKQTTRMQG